MLPLQHRVPAGSPPISFTGFSHRCRRLAKKFGPDITTVVSILREIKQLLFDNVTISGATPFDRPSLNGWGI